MKTQQTEGFPIMSKAEEFLIHCPYDEWIYFNTVPYDYHAGIIEVADSFIWKQRKIEFNDDESAFRITSA